MRKKTTIVSSTSAAVRLAAAREWLLERPPSLEAIVVAPTRAAADDFVRTVAAARGATFGLARASIEELIVQTARPGLAARNETPASRLGLEALAARVVHEAVEAGRLSYLAPVSARPGFRRTLLVTLTEIRLAGLAPAALAVAPRTGEDLLILAEEFDAACRQARTADDATLLTLATEALLEQETSLDGRCVVLLDVPIHSPLDRSFVDVLFSRAHEGLATVMARDEDTRAALASLGNIRWLTLVEPAPDNRLTRVQRTLFKEDITTDGTSASGALDLASVEFFSAPGEGREAVEIARRILTEAGRGVGFDEMAVLVRAPHLYAPHLEAAFDRAGIPAWFARGTSRPDPAGRAFLALLRCAAENLSAGRFVEYVSLDQVPRTVVSQVDRWQPPDDEGLTPPAREPDAEATARQTWRWERLLREAAVFGGLERWQRRLSGLRAERLLRMRDLEREEGEASIIGFVQRDISAIDELCGFAMPIIETLAAWPARARWGEWLEHLEAFAPQVLHAPGRVLAVLADLKPMADLGPVALAEVRDVLADRLTHLHTEPATSRQGRVLVGTPEAMRGRSARVVFVAGLGERVFPQRQRPDPLLLDAGRRAINAACDDQPELVSSVARRAAIAGALPLAPPPERRLSVDSDRTHDERLRLHIGVGAATERLYASYASMDTANGRPRVPSFYALDLHRAATGQLLDHDALAAQAVAAAGARLAWPAPAEAAVAIDAAEYDLATIRHWLLHPSRDAARGRARYLLELSAPLGRSLRSRYARSRSRWTAFDGLAREPHVQAALSAFRLRRRTYSPSALQRFATCPYQFYLASVLKLIPRDRLGPAYRLDPRTRGQLMHEVIAACSRELLHQEAWPTSAERLPAAHRILEAVLERVARHYHDDLAPPVDSVWSEEIATIAADLRGWLHEVSTSHNQWLPIHVELGIGFGPDGGRRDPGSIPEEATLDGGWKIHGVIDVVEQQTASGALRITDYKTGRNLTRGGFVVAGGSVLQPALYGLAAEAALARPVVESRLWFCTTAGRYATREVPLTPGSAAARRSAIEVLEIIDRAIEIGFLPQAPREGTCARCDYRMACGPSEEQRVRRKDQEPLADLEALRGMK